MEKVYYKSPIGVLEIICKEGVLVSLKLTDIFQPTSGNSNITNNVIFQLEEYFLGRRKSFDIKIKPEGTEFQKRVWSELQKIHFGKTKSYAEIAAAIGDENAQRAVGSACNKNPIMIIIPCHRVICKNGKPGGFAYGNCVKLKLLESENKNCTYGMI